MIAVSIYCFFIKHREKQQHFFHATTPLTFKRNWVLKIYYKIETNNKSKEINIKNDTCYYINDIIKFDDFDLDNILIDEKSNENILVSNI